MHISRLPLCWIECIFFALVFSWPISGCTSTPKQPVEKTSVSRLGQLGDFVRSDSFPPKPGGVYPQVSDISDDLLSFARAQYDSDGRVRQLLALYFLRHDAVLLNHGLPTAGGGPNTLIGLLWEKEAWPQGWGETPSMEMMREHIAASEKWLCLGDVEKKLLASNKAKFALLVEKWKAVKPRRKGQ